MELLTELLRKGNELHATDLHLEEENYPYYRVNGKLIKSEHFQVISQKEIELIVNHFINTPKKQNMFAIAGSFDASYSIKGIGNFRLNIYNQSGKVAIAIRLLPKTIPSFTSLGLPSNILELNDFANGLILVTGPTGSGKSTLIASLVNEINKKEPKHIITIENPIEYRYENIESLIHQRDVGTDADSFYSALVSSLRQDPDVIVLGEMRDTETITTAISAAETGHLVYSTLHTNGAMQAIDRIIDSFPAQKREFISTLLAGVLKSVISLQLIPKKDGSGLVAACEVLIITPAIRNLIRENKNYQIESFMQTNQVMGMVTIEASLASLVNDNIISLEEAKNRCHNISFLNSLIRAKAR
jgi:twitching motility protein PilT